ncbi:hypothetical protein Pmani_027572 [Petrolisthes manimaculis]|uniref:Uncharacterized protein n=1 Tax=Petrolisthes manimaculis TaxID=1843537 RepID=A0AAE1P3U1_9EUCA|nr:hypothetical protein Pmani_027572 [Petrolisthes manimaculis]
MKRPYRTPEYMKNPHSTPGYTKSPHSTSGYMKGPHNIPGHIKSPHSIPGHIKSPHSTPGYTKNPPGHIRVPHSAPGHMKGPHNIPGHVKNPHNTPGHMMNPHSTPNNIRNQHSTQNSGPGNHHHNSNQDNWFPHVSDFPHNIKDIKTIISNPSYPGDYYSEAFKVKPSGPYNSDRPIPHSQKHSEPSSSPINSPKPHPGTGIPVIPHPKPVLGLPPKPRPTPVYPPKPHPSPAYPPRPFPSLNYPPRPHSHPVYNSRPYPGPLFYPPRPHTHSLHSSIPYSPPVYSPRPYSGYATTPPHIPPLQYRKPHSLPVPSLGVKPGPPYTSLLHPHPVYSPGPNLPNTSLRSLPVDLKAPSIPKQPPNNLSLKQVPDHSLPTIRPVTTPKLHKNFPSVKAPNTTFPKILVSDPDLTTANPHNKKEDIPAMSPTLMPMDWDLSPYQDEEQMRAAILQREEDFHALNVISNSSEIVNVMHEVVGVS